MSNTGIDLPRAIKGCARGGLKCAFFDVTTTTSGTIDTTNSRGSWGGTIAKTGSETGRYTITLGRAVTAFAGGTVSIVGVDDTAYTNGKAIAWMWRDDDLSSDGTIELQLMDEDSNADTEIEDGARFTVMLWFFDGSDN